MKWFWMRQVEPLGKSGQQTPRRWGWGTPLKKRTATRTRSVYFRRSGFVNRLLDHLDNHEGQEARKPAGNALRCAHRENSVGDSTDVYFPFAPSAEFAIYTASISAGTGRLKSALPASSNRHKHNTDSQAGCTADLQSAKAPRAAVGKYSMG
jgi:hypothetical protein